MLQLVRKSRFKKDFKKLFSSGNDLDRLALIIRTLQAEEPLPEHNRDHALTGNYIGHRECHVSPDWLSYLEELLRRLLRLHLQKPAP